MPVRDLAGTVGADACQSQVQFFNLGAVFQMDGGTHRFHRNVSHIPKAAAAAAQEVDVVTAEGIIALHALLNTHPANLPQLLQELQVAVYRTQAQSGDLRPEVLIDLLRSGMRMGEAEVFQNLLPLVGITQLLFRWVRPLSFLCSLTIAYNFSLVNNNSYY